MKAVIFKKNAIFPLRIEKKVKKSLVKMDINEKINNMVSFVHGFAGTKKEA